VGYGLVSQRSTQQISAAVSPERVERKRDSAEVSLDRVERSMIWSRIQFVVDLYLSSKLKCRSHDETPSSRRGLK
jgi:hypothetical protein